MTDPAPDSIFLYNSLTRRKEQLETLHPDRVGMYVCGPTVYDFAHIGNARPIVVFDTLYRLLKTLYDEVTYVRNITDVRMSSTSQLGARDVVDAGRVVVTRAAIERLEQVLGS